MSERPTLALELNTENAARLRELSYETGAVREGGFLLTSGLTSNRYYEGKKVTLWPEGAHLVGKVFLELLSDTEIDAVGGMATGAYPIVTAISLVSAQQGRPIPAFVVREEAKAHGAQRRIEGHLQPGWRVAIIDDVITTAGSTFKAIEAAEEAQCCVVKVMALVDRCEGGGDKLRREGYDFSSVLSFKGDEQVQE